MKTCSEPKCIKPYYVRGFCRSHYRSKLRSGEIPMVQPNAKNGEAEIKLDELITAGHDLFNRRKRRKSCTIWPFGKSAGYARISKSKKYPTTLVARIICEEVYGPPPFEGVETCHSCGRGQEGCVEASHLYWGTHWKNMQDKITHGVSRRGEQNGMHKLTEEEVLESRKLRKRGWQYKEIGARYGVSYKTISNALNGHSWKWLK